jgi:hypothetical protein
MFGRLGDKGTTSYYVVRIWLSIGVAAIAIFFLPFGAALLVPDLLVPDLHEISGAVPPRHTTFLRRRGPCTSASRERGARCQRAR